MKIKYDSKANALYILFQERKCEISKEIEEGIIIDYTKDGKIIGIEIFEVDQKMNTKDVEEITFSIPSIKEET